MTIKRQAIFWGSFFLAIVGFILHIHQLFTMAAVLACLPLVLWLLGRHKLQGLQVVRQPLPAVSAGETVRIGLTVTNTARTRRIFFVVSDTVPKALASSGIVELPVAILGPGEHTPLHYDLLPPRRGAYPLGPVRLLAPDAIGMRQYKRDFGQPSELLVYPRPLPLPYLWPSSTGGSHPVRPRRRLRGQGDELYGIRDYVPGDDPRHIDWKTTARRGKLAVVEYERPESLDAMIVLDLSTPWHCGQDDQHTLEYAVTLAASLIEQAYERGSSVGLLAACGGGDFSCPPLAEEEQRLHLYEALTRAQADDAAPLVDLIRDHQQIVPPHCTVAVISPSPDGGAAATFLRGLDHPVVWFLLDAGSFAHKAWADYSDLEATLAVSRCKVHRVRGDRPLAANFGRGAALAVSAAQVFSHAL